MRTLARLLGFLAPHRRAVALAALLAAWTTAANAGLLAVAAYLVAASALKPPLSTLIPAVFIVQVLGGSRAFSRYADRILSHDLTFGLLKDLRIRIYERLEPLVPAFLTRARSGDLLARMVGDVEELQNFYLRAISPVVVATIVSALTFVALYVFSPFLAFVTLGFLALAGIGTPLLVGALERGSGRRQAALRADLDARLVDGLWGMTDLVAFGRARRTREEVAKLGRRLGEEQSRAAFVTGLREGVHDFLTGLATWTVLVLAIPRVASGEIGGVYLALLALLVLGSFEAVRPLGEAFQSLGGSVAAGERLFEITDERPEVEDPAKPPPTPAGREFAFDAVTFRYDEESSPALEDISFILETGKKVAVVGPSGSGKSTLVSLILRFHDPERGRALLDGEDLRGYAQEEARTALSVAAQDAHLFDATLRENLLLAKPDATDAEIWTALKKSQLGGFVRDLSGGLETRVGELGSRLSGGERRRLTVARAFLKNVPLLVLDEPTADLDARTERRLMDAVHKHVSADGRGLLLITHRLVRMEKLDEILVLDKGRMVERGAHEELMRANGMYKRMVGVQERMLTG